MVGRTFYKGCVVTVFLIVAVAFCSFFGDTDRSTRHMSWYGNSLHPLNAWTTRQSARKLLHITAIRQGVECRDVRKLHDRTAKCMFVKTTKDCVSDGGLIDYQRLVYCTFGSSVTLAMFLLVIWWLICFVGLAVTADDFFCPSLVVISKTMRLSPNVAGVTFLAFGNGAPDLFSAIAALGSQTSEGMGVGALLGAGMFVTTVVVGAIAIIKPFPAMQRPFMRDVIFYLIGVYWTFFVLWKGKMYLYEAIGFIALYAVYVIFVIVSSTIYKKLKARSLSNAGAILTRSDSTVPIMADEEDNEPTFYTAARDNLTSQDADILPAPSATIQSVCAGIHAHTVRSLPTLTRKHEALIVTVPTIQVDADDNSRPTFYDTPSDVINVPSGIATDATIQDIESGAYENKADIVSVRGAEWKLFLQAINPISARWSSMQWYSRAYEIFKIPVVLTITVICPVVSYDVGTSHNWNKYLQVLQCLISPTICAMLLQVGFMQTSVGVPVYGICLLVGGVLAITVIATSKCDTKPIYHAVFGYAGFLVAMVCIYVFANEIVNLLRTFGIVLGISNAILGLTLLAWGNSIGDLVADTVMAKQGLARMGFAACFGAPFFNLQLGFGIPMLIRMAKAGVTATSLQMNAVHGILGGSLMISLVSSIIILLFTNFKVKRSYGVYLLSLYAIFLVIVVLTETGVILQSWKP